MEGGNGNDGRAVSPFTAALATYTTSAQDQQDEAAPDNIESSWQAEGEHSASVDVAAKLPDGVEHFDMDASDKKCVTPVESYVENEAGQLKP